MLQHATAQIVTQRGEISFQNRPSGFRKSERIPAHAAGTAAASDVFGESEAELTYIRKAILGRCLRFTLLQVVGPVKVWTLVSLKDGGKKNHQGQEIQQKHDGTSRIRSTWFNASKGTEQTWGRAEGDPIFEAPLRREDSWTVSVTQKGPLGGLRVLNAAKVIHSDEEIVLTVHLGQRGDVGAHSRATCCSGRCE